MEVGTGDSRHWTYSVFSLAEETARANTYRLSVVLPRGFVESRVPQFKFHLHEMIMKKMHYKIFMALHFFPSSV